jgi:hypothetical protein
MNDENEPTMRTFSVAMALCLLAGPLGGVRAQVTLVRDGKPQATIVVTKGALSAQPDPKPDEIHVERPPLGNINAAARDLQEYVQKITGAKLPIVGDDKTPAGTLVLVGRSALTKPFDAKIPSGLTPARDEEGFVILCQGNRLVLAGNDAAIYHGTEYAVAELLHRQGVRWFMPGTYGEVVPQRTTLTVPEGEVRQKPSFKMRNWWGALPAGGRLDEYRWKIRNKMNPLTHFVTIPSDSSVRSLLPAALAKKEPELFARKADGSVDENLPCLSNPKAALRAAEPIKDVFRKNPKQDSYGFAPDDGLPRDYTPATVKRNLCFPDQVGRLGVPAELSCTEEWLDFVNAVAREVKKEFPHHVLTTNGYANRNTPPEGVAIEPNVWIMFAAIWSDTLHAYDNPRSWQTLRQGQMIQRWCELCPNVFMYDYTYIMLASGGTPVPLARKHKRDMPLLKKWGVIGFSDEGRRVLAESGIAPPYLRARLMWDVGLDGDAVLDEFFAKWYGPAAKVAVAFWDELEKALEETPLLGHEDRILPYVYTPELLARLEKHQAEAEKLADAEPCKSHVRADRLILEHLKGYLAMHRAEWACDFPEAVRQADYMLAQRKQLHALSPFYCMPDDKKADSGFYYWGLNARRDYYHKLAQRTTGKTGALVAVLPEEVFFRIDGRDEGRFARWYLPDHPTTGWGRVKTTVPFYVQGHLDQKGYPYLGALWYRLTVDVPANLRGKKVMLYVPAIETEAWGWVNGRFVGHRPYREAYERPNEIDFDVTRELLPAQKNVIVLRLHTGLNAAQAAAGMTSRAFLYAPAP